jgi:hypothetical protein
MPALATMSGIAGIRVRSLDLEAGSWPLGVERFEAIVVTNYLHRPLFPFLLAALVEDGVLLYRPSLGTGAMAAIASGFLLEPDGCCMSCAIGSASLPSSKAMSRARMRARSCSGAAVGCAAATAPGGALTCRRTDEPLRTTPVEWGKIHPLQALNVHR